MRRLMRRNLLLLHLQEDLLSEHPVLQLLHLSLLG